MITLSELDLSSVLVDFKLLKKQRLELVKLRVEQQKSLPTDRLRALDGIQNLLDAIADEAVRQKGEEVEQ